MAVIFVYPFFMCISCELNAKIIPIFISFLSFLCAHLPCAITIEKHWTHERYVVLAISPPKQTNTHSQHMHTHSHVSLQNQTIQITTQQQREVQPPCQQHCGVVFYNNPQMGHLRILKQRIKISEQENKYVWCLLFCGGFRHKHSNNNNEHNRKRILYTHLYACVCLSLQIWRWFYRYACMCVRVFWVGASEFIVYLWYCHCVFVSYMWVIWSRVESCHHKTITKNVNNDTQK